MMPVHENGPSFLVILVQLLHVARVSGDHSILCWPLCASSSKPLPYILCPGITMHWVNKTSELQSKVSVYLSLESKFYSWAVTKGLFSHVKAPIRDAAQAKRWCEATKCPTDTPETEQNCCLHYANVHFCPPLSPTVKAECRPWLPSRGSIQTHSTSQAGQVTKGTWTFNLSGDFLSKVSNFSMIAVFKIAGMMVMLETEIAIQKMAVCGDRICDISKGEDCDNCPDDCDRCSILDETQTIILAVALLVALFAISTGLLIYQRRKHTKALKDESWIIPVYEVLAGTSAIDSNVMTAGSMSDESARNPYRCVHYTILFISVAVVRGRLVAVKKYHNEEFQLTEGIRREVRTVRCLDHPNVCRFVGGTVEPGNVFLLFEYCPKGSLMDILQDERVPLNWAFRFSLLTDVARGMTYLHKHDLVHGNLKSSNCVVDDRWTCKVTDYGLQEYREEKFQTEDEKEMEERYRQKKLRDLVYKAPESNVNVTCASDVYSFAIIMVEVASRKLAAEVTEVLAYPGHWKPPLPLCRIEANLGERMTHAMRNKSYTTDCTFTRNYHELISKCWADKPADRPAFVMVENALITLNPCKRSPVDTMMDLMQTYSKNLEALVEDRSKQLLEEKQRTDALLHSILPRQVAESLKQGTTVQAEWFNGATVFFSDIVDFTALSARSTPMQVVELLNKLYTTFDSIIEKHNVYKVETIGDAYMVVSGVPERTGHHAVHVAAMSLAITQAGKMFTIPHAPREPLYIRVGLASGPVCAGVVGVKMPRYCLFGDTVNTASRMESTSEPYKIHISDGTYEELVRSDRFVCEPRGRMMIKGKGEMLTWWLTGVKKWDPSTADQDPDLSLITLPNKCQTSCTNLLSNYSPAQS